jgi:hypothetical protein
VVLCFQSDYEREKTSLAKVDVRCILNDNLNMYRYGCEYLRK